MKSETRLERLTKKDREYLTKWISSRPEINDDVARLFHEEKSIIQGNVVGMRERPERKGYAFQTAVDLLPGGLGTLASLVIQHGIANRLLRNSPVVLADSLFVASRLRYLSNLAIFPTYTSGGDCYHVFDVMLSLAANDLQAVEAYLRRYSHTAKRGHPFTILLCNSVSSVLGGRAGDVSPEKLRARKDGAYDQAMLSALAAIVEGDYQQLADDLQVMLTGHRRKSIDGGLLRFFAVPVHALFRMAIRHSQTAQQQLPIEPSDILWDAEVHAIQEQSSPTRYLEHIRILSPTIAEWSLSLPESVDAELFVDQFRS